MWCCSVSCNVQKGLQVELVMENSTVLLFVESTARGTNHCTITALCWLQIHSNSRMWGRSFFVFSTSLETVRYGSPQILLPPGMPLCFSTALLFPHNPAHPTATSCDLVKGLIHPMVPVPGRVGMDSVILHPSPAVLRYINRLKVYGIMIWYMYIL